MPESLFRSAGVGESSEKKIKKGAFVYLDEIKTDDKKSDRYHNDEIEGLRKRAKYPVADTKTDDGIHKLDHSQWTDDPILNIDVLRHLEAQFPSLPKVSIFIIANR